MQVTCNIISLSSTKSKWKSLVRQNTQGQERDCPFSRLININLACSSTHFSVISAPHDTNLWCGSALRASSYCLLTSTFIYSGLVTHRLGLENRLSDTVDLSVKATFMMHVIGHWLHILKSCLSRSSRSWKVAKQIHWQSNSISLTVQLNTFFCIHRLTKNSKLDQIDPTLRDDTWKPAHWSSATSGTDEPRLICCRTDIQSRIKDI